MIANKIQAAFAAFALSLVFAQTAVAADKKVRLDNGAVVTWSKSVEQGDKPRANQSVTVHYEGTLDDGTVFDSSYKRGQPISFALNRVIPCWTAGVQELKVGEVATLTCPSNTAYGPRGIPGAIPPNATLTFKVELLGIN